MSSAKHLRRSLLINLSVGIASIILFYFFVDKPLAFWISEHQLSCSAFMKMTYCSNFVVGLSALTFIFAFIYFLLKKPTHPWQKKLFFSALSLTIAAFLCECFFKIVFGRTWPNTWIDHNPSLLQDHVYGFFFFKFNKAYHSFPSGHATAIFGFFSTFWLAFPRLRFIAIILCLVEIIGLLAMNYHFASDIIAGALLGSYTGISIWHTLVFPQKSC